MFSGCVSAQLDREEAEGVLQRSYILDFMNSRNRMTIDPGIPTMPGRSMSGFHPPARYCFYQA